MWTLQALAQPADIQVELYPPFVEVADELALEHEETRNYYLKAVGASLTPVQCQALADLDRHLEQMSGAENARLWIVDALRSAPEWARTRQLAKLALDAMGWPSSPPPWDRKAVYINE